uniref:Uncharacterized protein n=1 Tax=Glossina austeni TaxID=7395 RepID=A0A1A9VQL7_GLOAU
MCSFMCSFAYHRLLTNRQQLRKDDTGQTGQPDKSNPGLSFNFEFISGYREFATPILKKCPKGKGHHMRRNDRACDFSFSQGSNKRFVDDTKYVDIVEEQNSKKKCDNSQRGSPTEALGTMLSNDASGFLMVRFQT